MDAIHLTLTFDKGVERKKAADAAKERRRLRHEDAKKRHKGSKLPMSEDQARRKY